MRALEVTNSLLEVLICKKFQNSKMSYFQLTLFLHAWSILQHDMHMIISNKCEIG